ncbi:hypothetical protein B0J13DRAFT_225884 [Dactylonectria estremocensis]|uniref:Uncharacterized protein n=1 Tax=Dactylonectria estremocensis TaxID=1079267 RepID=A0A9P9F7V8_9HYPO|nr:hypothetical protein B0J13DRAFT_225884 [Dactylonectria estremocensis]
MRHASHRKTSIRPRPPRTIVDGMEMQPTGQINWQSCSVGRSVGWLVGRCLDGLHLSQSPCDSHAHRGEAPVSPFHRRGVSQSRPPAPMQFADIFRLTGRVFFLWLFLWLFLISWADLPPGGREKNTDDAHWEIQNEQMTITKSSSQLGFELTPKHTEQVDALWGAVCFFHSLTLNWVVHPILPSVLP